MTTFRLRYVEGAHHGRFPHIRYPGGGGVDYATAEHMRQAMPEPDLFEICEDGE